MPYCFCASSDCYNLGGVDPLTSTPRGVFLDIRLYREHALADKKALFRKAQLDADAALEAQLQEITAHLSANTLADNVSGPPTEPGGSLWSRETSDAEPHSTSNVPSDSYVTPGQPPSEPQHPQAAKSSSAPSAPPPPTHTPPTCSPPKKAGSNRSREQEVICSLSMLESDVQKLLDEVQTRLANIGCPHPGGPPLPFPLLHYFRKSSDLRLELDAVTLKKPAVLELRDSISRKLQQIDSGLKSAKVKWTQEQSDTRTLKTPVYGIPHDTSHHYQSVLPNVDPILQVTFFMVVACQIILGVSRRGCSFLLKMVQYIIQLTLFRSGPNLTQRDEKLLSNIPNDIRDPEEHFSLKNSHTVFAVCPNPDCHQTYEPKFEQGSPVPIYPKQCNHREFHGGRKCATPLLKPKRVNGHTIFVPIKPFLGFSFKDWVGALLSRSGYEKKMNSSWDSCKPGGDPIPEMKDIFDGDMLRNFKGPDGLHFSVGNGEGRYVFSMCVDFFNPLGNKQAGKKKSVGLISLVCLNLPPELRYRPENMFLYGVVPGPNEPPLACLNHYLRHLIDELLEFWHTGVRFSRTREHFYGWVVRCALICVVCDLPAARKLNGFASLNHNQACAICRCARRPNDFGNTYARLWERRTGQDIRNASQRYTDAQDHHERAEIVQQTGIRCSELHRLPYFDPARFVVVDAMHNLFLGLIQEHFEILGIRLNDKTGDTTPAINIDIPIPQALKLNVHEHKSLVKLIKMLESPIKQELHTAEGYQLYFKRFSNLHRPVLELAFKSLGVRASVNPDHVKKAKFNKANYTTSLLNWRLAQVETPRKFRKGAILTVDEMTELRSDIEHMVTPSWLTSIPANLGEPSHGKLKSDQWRTLGTTYLPISLIRLWDRLDENDARSADCKKLLSVTVSLISAVIIASSRTTSSEKADLYLIHMQEYLSGLRELFPLYNFRPNHHMALHLPEYIKLYGPVHSWWTFPFERLIGLLQRIPTNFQNGQLEETISTSFTTSSNLRALLLKEGCPTAIKNCQSLFAKLVDPQVRNTLLTDISRFSVDLEDDTSFDPNDTAYIPEDIYKALRSHFLTRETPRVAKVLTFYTMNGLTFSSFTRHHGNSSILVRRPSLPSVPAQIESIIQISSTETLFIVKYLLKSMSNDPFEKYPTLNASLWSPNLGQLVAVKPEDVESHFARLPIVWDDTECVAVISLSREY